MGPARRMAKATIRGLLGLLPTPTAFSVARSSRRLARNLPMGIERTIDYYLGDLRVCINTNSNIEKEMVTGVYDASTVQVIQRFVKAGDTCFDIGANVRPLTLAMAKQVRKFGRILAFEPGPAYYKRLVKNLRLNPLLDAVTNAENKGLSDKEGTLYWLEDKSNPATPGSRQQEMVTP